ncbi:hypothetical protein [Nocardia sp. NPDC004415]
MNTSKTGGQDDLNSADAVTTHDDDEQARGSNLGTNTTGSAGHADESPNREAARYRVRLREAEGEVARLGGVVENLQKAAVESALGDRITAKAFWASRGESGLSGLLTGDGTVDSGKVAEAVDTAVQEFGLGPRRPEPNPYAGSNSTGEESDRWVNAFTPRG